MMPCDASRQQPARAAGRGGRSQRPGKNRNLALLGALTFIAPHFWTFTKIGKTGRCSVENYCGKTMTRASALDLWGTFLGCIQRVWVCIMVIVSKSAVTRAPTIALHETSTSSPSSQFGVVEKTIVCLLGHL